MSSFGTAPLCAAPSLLGIVPPHLSCGHLSREEQLFANYLHYFQRAAFCQELTRDQRRESMRLARKERISPNAAVDKVIMQNRMSMMGTYPSVSEPSPCDNLRKRQYQFALTLSRSYRRVYCMQLNASQRKRSLKLARKYPMITSDQAVRIIMEEAGMMGARSYQEQMISPRCKCTCQ